MARRPRRRIETDFPAAARLILSEYRAFLAEGAEGHEDGEAKAFAAHHAAGRAALAHLEQLIKLAGETGDEDQVQALGDCLAEWRAKIPRQLREEPEPDDDDGG